MYQLYFSYEVFLVNETKYELYKYRGQGYGSEEACLALRSFFEAKSIPLERDGVAAVGKFIIIILAITHLLKELFQVTQVRISFEIMRVM